MAVPHEPRRRKSIRLDNHERSYVNDNFYKLYMKSEKSPERQERSNLFEDKESSADDSSDHDEQKIENTKKTQNEKVLFSQRRNHSRTVSPEKRLPSPKKKILLKIESRSSKSSMSTNKQNGFYWLFVSIFNSMSYYPFIVAMVLILMLLCLSTSEKQHVQCIDNPDLLLFKSIQRVRTKFYNQKPDIWNDISSAINEMISRTPKVPSIMLLYANETNTMNCLATEIADVSSTILHTNGPMRLNPEDFGDDAGEIINELNEKLPTQKVVIIHNILNINANAIKALHNLCDRINPLVGEVIYILTMQTNDSNNDYQTSQKNLAFVEKQIYQKFLGSIDLDILSALVTRITDGAIISVQPEPHLRYCT